MICCYSKCCKIQLFSITTTPIFPSLFLNPLPPRPAQTAPFIVLLWLTRDILLVKGEPLDGKGWTCKWSPTSNCRMALSRSSINSTETSSSFWIWMLVDWPLLTLKHKIKIINLNDQSLILFVPKLYCTYWS